jgi:predicted enzyme related to lactoylglutathione lyase
MAHGAFMWNELMTTDVEKAKAFYAATVGWKIEAMPMPGGSYWIAKVGDTPVAGMMKMTPEMPAGTPPHWFSYLEVDDVDARVKAIAANGGKVMRPPFDIPEVGRIAIIADATGAVMGWMTPKR